MRHRGVHRASSIGERNVGTLTLKKLAGSSLKLERTTTDSALGGQIPYRLLHAMNFSANHKDKRAT